MAMSDSRPALADSTHSTIPDGPAASAGDRLALACGLIGVVFMLVMGIVIFVAGLYG